MIAVIKIPKIWPMTGKQREDRFEANLKTVKKMMESRCHYYPLDLNTVFNQFAEEIQTSEFDAYLENTIKDFMIKQAYFSLEEEEFIPKIVHKISNQYALNPELYPDILDYARNELEKNQLKRIRGFKEEGKFTTFLYAVTRNLVLNFLDKHNQMNNAAAVNTGDIMRIFHELDVNPLNFNIQSEEEEMMQKIAEIVESLDAKEKVVFKMFYYESVDVSKIAGTFATTWHKTNKLLKRATSVFLTELRKTKYFFHLNLRCEDLIKRIKKLRRQK